MRRAAAAKADAGALPGWDLSDLYPGPRSDEVRRDLEQAAAAAEALHEEFAGRVGDLDGEILADLIARYEAIKETLERLTSYAYLVYCTAMDDAETAQFFQTVREETTATESRLLFLTLELNRIEDDALADKLKAPALARYAPWVRDVRAFRPFQLSDEVERLLLEKQVAGRAAWMRLFDETMAALRFPVRGEALGSAEALNLLSDKDRDVRREAAQALGTVLGENVRTFALITNTLAKDKEIEDQWRGFERPISARNLGNRVEDEVVDALIAAVEAAAPRLAHRYYALKARWMGVDRLDYWDRNAPLPEDDDRTVGWDEAISTVLAAYRAFSPELAGIGRRFFDNDWIDVPVRNGKSPGAFAHPTVPGAHPYLLLNYQGKARDVMILAHELGHGVHQVLAGGQGLLMAETPLTLAETASVFGEQLTFRALLDGESEPERRRVMLAGKVEDMLNTVVRQVAFCAFERRVHEERRAGELTPERLSEHWLAVQSESLGPALRFHDEYRFYWAYIPHFIHAPFYVYAYAFGECLVNALYAVYRAEPAGFEQKYLDMLRAGGSLRHRELVGAVRPRRERACILVARPGRDRGLRRRVGGGALNRILNPFGEPDREPGAALDGGAERLVAGRPLRSVGEAGLAVPGLVGAEFFEGPAQFGLVLAEALGLARVMLLDHLLDRDGAGHRRPLAEQRARRTQRIACDVPDRGECGRPHPALDQQRVKGVEMRLLRLGHFADGGRGAAPAQHRELAVVDPLGAVLAGVIHTDHARDRLLWRGVAGEPVLARERGPRLFALLLVVHARALHDRAAP